MTSRDLDKLENGANAGTSPWMKPARLAWVGITLLTLGLLTVSFPDRLAQIRQMLDPRSLAILRIAPDLYAGYLVGLGIAVYMVHILVAGVLFLRRPEDGMALFVAYTLVTNGALIPLAGVAINSAMQPLLWQILSGLIIAIGLFSSVVLLYLFPDGRFIPKWTRVISLVWFALVIVIVIESSSRATSPSGIQLLLLFGVLAVTNSGLYSQVYRYQYISTPTQRQQTKWAIFGLAAAVLGPVVYFIIAVLMPNFTAAAIPNMLFQRLGASFFAFSLMVRLVTTTLVSLYLLLFPLSFGVAVLRYRLWDIDILIRRTLIYSLLTGALALIYIGGIVLLQELFSSFTQGSQLAVVFSTLGTAALFTPLQRRIQNGIDRRFYRNRYDADKILADFSVRLRDEVDLDELQNHLLVVVEDTLQPKFVSLWLQPAERLNIEELEVSQPVDISSLPVNPDDFFS